MALRNGYFDLARALEQLGLDDLPVVEDASAPICEHVADRLADVLLDLDAVSQVLRAEHSNGLSWLEPHIQRLYDDVNSLMGKMVD